MSNNAKHVALLGRVGHGKSTFGNTIFDKKEFQSALKATGVTTSCETKTGNWKGDSLRVTVTDTPGMSDTNLSQDQVFQLLANSILAFSVANGASGVSAFCVCLTGKETRVPSNIIEMMRSYEKLLGKGIWDHCVIIVTNCDPIRDDSEQELEDKERQDFCAGAFPQEFEKEFGVRLPVFRSSKFMNASSSADLKAFKDYLNSKTTYYTCGFFRELQLAYQAGGWAQTLTHAVQKIRAQLTFSRDGHKIS